MPTKQPTNTHIRQTWACWCVTTPTPGYTTSRPAIWAHPGENTSLARPCPPPGSDTTTRAKRNTTLRHSRSACSSSELGAQTRKAACKRPRGLVPEGPVHRRPPETQRATCESWYDRPGRVTWAGCGESTSTTRRNAVAHRIPPPTGASSPPNTRWGTCVWACARSLRPRRLLHKPSSRDTPHRPCIRSPENT